MTTLRQINGYVASKQRLLPTTRLDDVAQLTRDIVALHATNATGPYLSLWARGTGFRREALDGALYERRELVRLLCMRETLHVVPSDEIAYFLRAYVERRAATERRRMETLLVEARLCPPETASELLDGLHGQVLRALSESGPCTVQQMGRAVPELAAKVRYSVGRAYEGELSIGSRLVPSMCALGLLVRARPRGTWRSNLYEYAVLSDWLPGIEQAEVTAREARTWLVHRYLTAFGPATFEDVQWWTGLSVGETRDALGPLQSALKRVRVEDWDADLLMLSDEAEELGRDAHTRGACAFFLPGLDPYVMGYRDRRRFLAPGHQEKVFDRTGNAMPTVWARGRVVGAWAQRRDGSLVYGLFESVSAEVGAMLAVEARRLDAFLDGERLPLPSHTPFTHAMVR